ncbi:hypothetical protein [Croceicoccus marinus]|jgi:hypothetical protein|uniref:Uncharacterized protein n=1 Tax=Croceicoccus marinus TaxID=450378 RepID=A0A7G6VT26_9SPHN|nr:hypothetical protein [Croceicoccus marinus]QNE04891.1 hypothetical protein H4O24_13355 [Croceicoccus marinus]
MRSQTLWAEVPALLATKPIASRSQQSREEGDAHIIAIVATDLEPGIASAGVAGIDRHMSVVTTLVCLAAMALEQHAMDAARVIRPALLSQRSEKRLFFRKVVRQSSTISVNAR